MSGSGARGGAGAGAQSVVPEAAHGVFDELGAFGGGRRLNFRALLVDKTYPDLVAEVSKRLEKEPETVLLRSYAYSEGKVWKSRDITQKQVSDWAARVAAKLELTADSVVCLDLPLVGVALVREA